MGKGRDPHPHTVLSGELLSSPGPPKMPGGRELSLLLFQDGWGAAARRDAAGGPARSAEELLRRGEQLHVRGHVRRDSGGKDPARVPEAASRSRTSLLSHPSLPSPFTEGMSLPIKVCAAQSHREQPFFGTSKVVFNSI